MASLFGRKKEMDKNDPTRRYLDVTIVECKDLMVVDQGRVVSLHHLVILLVT